MQNGDQLFWERMKGESAKAYAAFSVYRDLGPMRRIPEVARQLAKHDSLLRRWSAKWRWQERCFAYDLHTDREHRRQIEEARLKMPEREAMIANKALSVAAQRLLSMDVEKLSPMALARLFEVAVRVETTARAEIMAYHQEQLEAQREEYASAVREARRTLRDGRSRFPGLSEEQMRSMTARAFGVNEDDLLDA